MISSGMNIFELSDDRCLQIRSHFFLAKQSKRQMNSPMRGRRGHSHSLSPTKTAPNPYRSPQLTDGRRTGPPIPEWVEKNVLYVYVHGLRSDPPLLKSIGPFLDGHPELYADSREKLRLQKLPSRWDRNPNRQAPHPSDAKLGAKFIHKLKFNELHQPRRMSDASSVSDDSTFEHQDPPPQPPKALSSKAKRSSAPFKPAPAIFTMSSTTDPPTTPTDPWGFDVNELNLNDLFASNGFQIVPINPEDPASLPPGFFAFDGKVLVSDKGGSQTRIKKTGIIAVMPSPEAAKIVGSSVPKLERSGRGFAFDMPHHDPTFAKQFDDVIEQVAAKTSKTVQDTDGTHFTSEVSI